MAWDNYAKAVWKFENNLTDSSGNGNTATPYGGSTTYSSVVKHDDTYSLYMANNYAYAVNTGNGSTFSASIGSETTAYGWEAWLYYLPGGSSHFCGKWGIQSPVIVMNDGGVSTAWNNSTVTFINGNYSNAWHHIAWTYDVVNDVFKIYVNNTLSYTRTSAGKMFAGSEAMLTGMSWNQPSYGYIDNCIITVGTLRTSFPTVELPTGKAGIKIGFNCGGNNRTKIGGRI